jgi:hypothetical protein
VNQRGRTFIDIIDEVWADNPRADKHGAAWADFDNDGDQDLVELVDVLINDDGTVSKGRGRNHLFVNENGKLVNKAKELGLDSMGQGRTPLWFDADRDGRLDLLVVNTRSKDQPSSAIFRQGSDGFTESSNAFGFRDDERSRWDRLWDLVHNAFRFHFKEAAFLYMSPHLVFGQLADLFGDGALSLVLFSLPTRVYSMSRIPFTEVTATVGFPSISNRSVLSPPVWDMVSDVAIEDFNGDGKLDMYMTRGERYMSDVVQLDSNTIIGTLEGMQNRAVPKTVSFSGKGIIKVDIYPPWRSLSEIFIGSMGRHPGSRSFSLSPEDSEVSGPVPTDTARSRGLFITYDLNTRAWTLHSSHPGNFDFIVHSAAPINNIQTFGFQHPFREDGVDALLIRRGNEYVLQELPGDAGAPTSCHSVVAGDFDNDMDVDLYLVCTGPVNNLPDRLLENDGKGRFRLVPNAGGASGSQLGRGDVGVTADYDRDGFLDLFITNGSDPTSPFTRDGPHQLFHNRGNNNHWLEIDLEGVKSNRDGIGASIIIEAGGTRQIREQRGGMHLLSQNHQRVHFGLGKNSMVDRLTIRWPSGSVQELGSMSADRILKIREGAGPIHTRTESRNG